MPKTSSHLDQITVRQLPESSAGCEDWCFCCADEITFVVPEVTGQPRNPPSPLLS